MTKADLIDLIAERTKMPHGRAELLICQMFDAMVDADGLMSATEWARTATSLALWLLLPLAIGWWRVTRDEVR